jgi:2-dehydro-3-deoxy-D-gluconate 5-dehydrogenase
MLLNKKVALVTGAGQGLGAAIAQAFAAQGAHVAVADINADAANAVAAKINAAGGTAQGFACNVADRAQVNAMTTDIAARLGKIDILVNNAGIIRRADALEFSEKDWDDVIDLNLKAVFFLSQAVARQFILQETQGRIINIASMLSFQGGIRVPSYTASKSGVMGLTRLMANEWSQYGITVNAIAPGYMATNNTIALRADADRSVEILGRIPAARWGLPADLAGPVVFLASAASAYVTGHTLAVDGGWLAR